MLRPNKRFLATVVRNTDDHNKSLLRQLEVDAARKRKDMDKRSSKGSSDHYNDHKSRRGPDQYDDHNNRSVHEDSAQGPSKRMHYSNTDDERTKKLKRNHEERSEINPSSRALFDGCVVLLAVWSAF